MPFLWLSFLCLKPFNWESQGQKTLTTDLQGGLQLQQDGLAEEDLPGFDAKPPDLRLCHLDNLPRATSPHWRREKRQDSSSGFHRNISNTKVVRIRPWQKKGKVASRIITKADKLRHISETHCWHCESSWHFQHWCGFIGCAAALA